jgi:acyl-CoA synthetase (AMP-forming)/AMP-acid ligase II
LDCPENAVFQNAILADEAGSPREIPRAVGIYERDGGVLWKWRNEARRSRQLVIATNAHLGNYDYRFNWVFQEDGYIAMEILLTGIMTVKGVANPINHDESANGHPVAPGLVQQFQERFGCYIHNIYGLTESTSPTHAVPLGTRAPVDPESGALSVGVPVPGCDVRLLDLADPSRPAAPVAQSRAPCRVLGSLRRGTARRPRK